MSKKLFIEEYSKVTGKTKKDSEDLVNAFLDTVENLVIKGEDVQFVGWGSFKVQVREEREGINPRTKETIKIPAKKVLKFKVGKKLADKVAK